MTKPKGAPSPASASRSAPDWIGIQGEYIAGQRSLRDIASEHGITEGTIRHRAKLHGWVRNAPQTKRQIVAARMAGITQNVAQNVMRNIEEAAAQDIGDLERGLRINRHCLMALEQSAEQATEPREVKIIVEAAGQAIDSIRRIRGLGDEDRSKSGASTDDDDDARAADIASRLVNKLARRATGGVDQTQTPVVGVAPVGA